MKTAKIVAIVIWAVTALILFSMLAVGLTGNFFGLSFNVFGNRYDHAGDYTPGNTQIDEQIHSIRIDWTAGSVRVEAYDGETVSVSESGEYKDEYQLRWLVRDGKLRVQYCKSRIFWGFFHVPAKDLTILVPREMAEHMQEIEIDCVSPEVTVSDLFAETVQIDTVSGDVTLRDVSAREFELDGVSADVSISGMLETIDIDTVSSRCVVIDSVMPEKIDYEAVSGDLELTMADGDGFTADFDKVSGSFDCAFPTTYTDHKYVYRDGSARYSFDTVSGDIIIYQADAETNAP